MTDSKDDIEGDPLDLLLSTRRKPQPSGVSSAKPFDSGEHVFLGQSGAELACVEFSKVKGNPRVFPSEFEAVQRLGSHDQLSYGELVALAGDFYATAEELFEGKTSKIPWLTGGTNLGNLREIFDEELAWVKDRMAGKPNAAYPDNNLSMAWSAKAYLELALDNNVHFGWHNMLAYVVNHREALELARRAKGQNNEDWRRAVFTNGFADHFLTDGFAAGHIRVPRAEIRVWAKKNGFSDKLAGALSKLLHDQDGHIDTMHSSGEGKRDAKDGLRVTNATGKDWYTRCDGQLFLNYDKGSSPLIEVPVRAVAESVKELLRAWKQDVLPDGTYAATHHVAYPHPKEPQLQAKFPVTMSQAKIQKLVDSVKWYVKIPWIGSGIDAEKIKSVLEALPSLMANFRANIAQDIKARGDDVSKLASAYVEAYSKLG